MPAHAPRPIDPPPDYLRGVDGLPDELAELADAGDERRLTADEERTLDAGILRVRLRFAWARIRRDGRLQ